VIAAGEYLICATRPSCCFVERGQPAPGRAPRLRAMRGGASGWFHFWERCAAPWCRRAEHDLYDPARPARLGREAPAAAYIHRLTCTCSASAYDLIRAVDALQQ
jgi:hypothetical protein